MKKSKLVLTCFFVIVGFLSIYLLNHDINIEAFNKPENSPVEAFGTIEYLNSLEVVPSADGRVTDVYFGKGDAVKAGDLMYELDSSHVNMEISRLKNSINQAQLARSTAAYNLQKLKTRAPFSGYVTNITVYSGDTVSKNDALLTLTDQSKMRLYLPFNSVGIEKVKPGQKAKVCIWEFMSYYDGTVSYVSNTPRFTPDGGKLYDVEIIMDNPGAFKEGMKATAEIDTGALVKKSIKEGTLEYINKVTVRSEAEGIVQKINARENQYVNKGSLLVELVNDELVNAKRTADLRLQELQTQLQYEQAKLSQYKVYAPVDGTVIDQKAGIGAFVKAGEPVAVIADTNEMKVVVPVKERDISRVKIGQQCTITVDAIPEPLESPITGKVVEIGHEPVMLDGETAYRVTVKFTPVEGLKYGMHAAVGL